MNSTYSSIKWTKETNVKQTAQAREVHFMIRHHVSHDLPFVLFVSHDQIPVWKWMPHFQFATEAEAREFAVEAVNHFVVNQSVVQVIKSSL